MKNTALYNKMKSHGYGYRFCATIINAKFGSNVHFTDVYNFIHRNYKKIGRDTKRFIRDFFIIKGWIAKPKPRKAPVCRRCGLKYPTRKKSVRSNQHTKSRSLLSIH